MNDIKIFNNEEFGDIRTVTIDGEPWFVGKDVAEILGYSNSRDALAKRVDEEDKGVAKCDTLGGTQELTVINESGLYSLILSSKLQTAKKFKHWVTSEVLPSIRRQGSTRYRTFPKRCRQSFFWIRERYRWKREWTSLNLTFQCMEVKLMSFPIM